MILGWYAYNMLFYISIYSATIALATLYAMTLPWQLYAPHKRTISWVSQLLVVVRIIGAGIYLALLLLYLPTIHFILNMILFTGIVGLYMSYKLARI